MKKIYATVEEASEAAIRLGAISIKTYLAARKKDPKLPRHPHQTYGVNYRVFLGNPPTMRRKKVRKQYSFRSAMRTVRKLRFKDKDDYRKRRGEDTRLPSRPEIEYKKLGWKNWGTFLGTGRARRLYKDCYQTWQEAGRAGWKLGARSSTEYRSIWKDDPKLPRNPDEMYAKIGWPGEWDKFLLP